MVEVISHCHTAFGRLNKTPTPTEMLKMQRDGTISVAAVAKGKDPEGKIVRGVLVDRDLPEFTDVYYGRVVARAKELVGRAEA